MKFPILLKTIFVFALISIISCDGGPKDIRLNFTKDNDINVIGTHAYLVSKIGPMAQSVSKNSSLIKEPSRGVTRLIVRNTKLTADKSDYIFDINFSSTIDVKGDGQYRLNKQANSNVWLLEINSDDVNTLSIVEGPPSQSTNYAGIGFVLIIIGVILIIVGIPTIIAGGVGCLLSLLGFVLICIGYNLTLPA